MLCLLVSLMASTYTKIQTVPGDHCSILHKTNDFFSLFDNRCFLSRIVPKGNAIIQS